jgi:hypothetical protein
MRTFAAALFAACLPAFAWGPEGHHLIARIAEAQLTPAARARIAQILAANETLVSVSVWPDEIRRSRPETGNWHYIDIPIDKPHLDMARDCPKGDCVLAKIEDFRKMLADPAVTPAQRHDALLFLVHFVGDMHQPLHCSDHGDKGGNGVRVHYGTRQLNLHSLWDSALLGKIGAEDQLFPAMSGEAARKAKKWSRGGVNNWAEEAHKQSQKVVYGKLPKTPAAETAEIGPAYEAKADPLVRIQIEKAGDRLARILNDTLR